MAYGILHDKEEGFMYMIVNGLGKTKNEMSMVTALRAVVVATAVTQPKDSTMP